MISPQNDTFWQMEAFGRMLTATRHTGGMKAWFLPLRIGPGLLVVKTALLAVLLSASLAGAQAAVPAVRVVETYPAGGSLVLPRNQDFYLRLAYETDKPIGIWITPYFQGKAVPAGTSPSIRYSGKGEALAWFFFMRPGQRADEIRIRAGDGGYAMPVVASYPVQVAGGDFPAASSSSPWAPTEPAWVKDLQERANRQIAANSAASQGTVGPGAYLFLGGFMLAVGALALAGLAAPIWAMRRWRGGWRLAAAIPLALLGFVVLRILAGTATDPTSHNLWPFEILLAGLTGLGILAVLALARRFVAAER